MTIPPDISLPSAVTLPFGLAVEDAGPYWEGLRQRRFCLQRCAACGHLRFPPMPACSSCGTIGGMWDDVSTVGHVYSWVTVHRAFRPEFADRVPYHLVTVDLEAGPRIVGRQLGEAAPVIGQETVGSFEEHDTWTEFVFVPAADAARTPR